MEFHIRMNNEVAEYVQAKLSPTMKRLIARLNGDLYYGPTYLTAEGEPCSMFDAEYDHAFDFGRALDIVRRYANIPDGVFYVAWSGEITEDDPEEPHDEVYLFEDSDVKALALGFELARLL